MTIIHQPHWRSGETMTEVERDGYMLTARTVKREEAGELFGLNFVVTDSVPADEVHFYQGKKLVGKLVNIERDFGRKVPNLGVISPDERPTDGRHDQKDES